MALSRKNISVFAVDDDCPVPNAAVTSPKNHTNASGLAVDGIVPAVSGWRSPEGGLFIETSAGSQSKACFAGPALLFTEAETPTPAVRDRVAS
jgi:hypothetical protein